MTEAVESSERVMIELIKINWLAGAFVVMLIVVLTFIYLMWRHNAKRDDIVVEIMNKQIETGAIITRSVDELVRRCHNKIGVDSDEG